MSRPWVLLRRLCAEYGRVLGVALVAGELRAEQPGRVGAVLAGLLGRIDGRRHNLVVVERQPPM